MLERMTDVAEPAVGFRARGVVTGEDYRDTLIPALEAALEEHDKLRFIYVLGPEFESFETSAMLDDTMFGLRHYFQFEKIAVVTDHQMWAAAMRMFGYLMPCEVRVFPVAELAEAESWVAG